MDQSYMDKIYNWYSWVASFSDPRTKGWFLVDSPVPVFFLTATYLAIVWIGPKIMKYRKPYQLNTTLIIYNLFLAALNVHIVIEYYTASVNLKHRFICEPHIPTNIHPDELRIVNATYWYYLSKFLEFADTFFFILRKKDKQLSFLHIYHHSTIFPFWWLGIKWAPTGFTYFTSMINAGVHVIMYSYYGLAAMGPTVAKYLWWKKYITMVQLFQFAAISGISLNALRVGCDYPRVLQIISFVYMISFLILFGSFYANTYKPKDIETVHSPSKHYQEEMILNNNAIEKIKKDAQASQNGVMKKNI